MHRRTKVGGQVHGAGHRRPLVILQLGAVALASVTLVSCAHATASTVVELPPLEMPEPPPRVVAVVEPEPLPVVVLPEEPHTTVRSRPAQPPRQDAPRQEPPKGDPVVVETPKPADNGPTAPPTTLQTTPTQREGEVERRIRILVAQARNDLNRVNYQASTPTPATSTRWRSASRRRPKRPCGHGTSCSPPTWPTRRPHWPPSSPAASLRSPRS